METGMNHHKKVQLMRHYVGYKHGYYMAAWGTLKRRMVRMSWNWASALFGFLWFAYRKMYGYACVFFILFILLSAPYCLEQYCLHYSEPMGVCVCNVTAALGLSNVLSFSQSEIEALLFTIRPYFLLFPLACMLVCGAYGNYLYLRTVRKRIRRLPVDHLTEYEQSMLVEQHGGVSHASLVIAVLMLQSVLILIALVRKGLFQI